MLFSLCGLHVAELLGGWVMGYRVMGRAVLLFLSVGYYFAFLDYMTVLTSEQGSLVSGVGPPSVRKSASIYDSVLTYDERRTLS